MRIQSNDIVILDTTDSKTIDLHISSNHPTVQIHDPNNSQNPVTPDWSVDPLELTPIIYIDGVKAEDSLINSFTWSKVTGSGLTEEEVEIDNSKVLIRSNNKDLEDVATLRYRCTVVYNNGKSFSNEITFARVDVGKDGANGYTPQKGVDYFDGEDGKSVNIKGTAYSKSTPITGSEIVLYPDEDTNTPITEEPGAVSGDAYLVQGYLCVYNEKGNNFICTGKIQGPKGEQGDSSFLFIRYADSINPTEMFATAGNRKYIGFYRSSTNVAPTDTKFTTWGWTKFVGEDAKSISLSAPAQVFRVDKDGNISPSTLKVSPQAINTSVTEWYYSKNGGIFSTTPPYGVIKNTDGSVTITGELMIDDSISIQMGDGSYSDVLTIYKVYDGKQGADASIAFLTNENISFVANTNGKVSETIVYTAVVGYSGSDKIDVSIGEITDVPDGMEITEIDDYSLTTYYVPEVKYYTLIDDEYELANPQPTSTDELSNGKYYIYNDSKEKILQIKVNNDANLGSESSNNGSINIPVFAPVATNLKLSWSKINSGPRGEIGVGINSTTVQYSISDSASTIPSEDSWRSTIPSVPDGQYLWTRTITDYTDDSIDSTVTHTYAKQGVKGDTGSAGSSVTVYKIEYQAGTSAITAPTGTWSSSVVSVEEGNYLWTKTTFSDNKVAYGVAKQGAKGDKGDKGEKGDKGDQGVQGPKGNDGQQYYTWVKYADTPTSGMSNNPDGKVYIGLAYNKTTATESNTYSDYMWSLIKGETGAVGPKGTDGQQYYTWIKYADNASGANMSDSPNGKSYIGLAYNKTTSTESTTASDYTWALFKGDKGDTGANGTSASLVDITPSALYFKSTTGKNGTFTPDYIYLYPRFQTVTFSKWEYSVNGGTTWVAASGANGLTISTYNSIANTLRVAKTSTLYTDTITSISFRCVSSNASVYDTVSIAKLFDVDVEEINTRITDSLAEVKTTTDSITSRVTATETSIGTINNNISSITNRVSAAEQKVTPTAIVSTVRSSTDYTNDLGKKVNSTEIISKINQTAESVTISANKIGLLGTTNIPDLTADKIKGGTLTLGGSNATTQSGQLLVKNESDTEMLKLNKDGIVVKSGHLAIAEDFANSRFDWETETWYTTTNTRQLDLGDTYIRMGVYSPSGYTNYMRLLDNGLYFSGNAQGLGSWGSFIGHSSGDFVIQDSVRSNISFRGYGGDEMANISSDGLYVNGPISGGITSGNAKQLSNVFVKNFSSSQTGYIAIRLGTTTRSLNSMITIKGHVTSYQNSTSFEASCYFYQSNSVFYNPVATISNPDILREVYFAEGANDGYVYLIIGSTNSAWSYPTVAIDTLTIGYSGNTAYEWHEGWTATTHTNLSSFKTVTPCHRGGMKKVLWSGAVKNGATITVNENIRNFKFLTCIIGEETSDLGIVLGTFLDDTLPQLHFGAIFTETNGLAGNDLMGAKFRMNSETSLTLDACASKFASTLHCKKIVGWR